LFYQTQGVVQEIFKNAGRTAMPKIQALYLGYAWDISRAESCHGRGQKCEQQERHKDKRREFWKEGRHLGGLEIASRRSSGEY